MKMKTGLFLWMTTVACMLAASGHTVADERQRERWDRAVCLHTPPKTEKEKGNLSSAFIVSNGEALFLVTAAHAADETQSKTRLYFTDTDGKPQWVSLRVVVQAGENPWSKHRNSDIAIAKLELQQSNPYLPHFTDIAIPLNSISVKPVKRTTRIEIAGYPFGLGIPDQVSPIVVAGQIASTEIETKNKWGTEPLIYCSPDVAQGTSGGPAFLTTEDSESVTVVGMFVAVIYDASGGKLSKLVPARIIHEAIAAEVH